jgi:hypothetical protein
VPRSFALQRHPPGRRLNRHRTVSVAHALAGRLGAGDPLITVPAQNAVTSAPSAGRSSSCAPSSIAAARSAPPSNSSSIWAPSRSAGDTRCDTGVVPSSKTWLVLRGPYAAELAVGVQRGQHHLHRRPLLRRVQADRDTRPSSVPGRRRRPAGSPDLGRVSGPWPRRQRCPPSPRPGGGGPARRWSRCVRRAVCGSLRSPQAR